MCVHACVVCVCGVCVCVSVHTHSALGHKVSLLHVEPVIEGLLSVASAVDDMLPCGVLENGVDVVLQLKT